MMSASRRIPSEVHLIGVDLGEASIEFSWIQREELVDFLQKLFGLFVLELIVIVIVVNLCVQVWVLLQLVLGEEFDGLLQLAIGTTIFIIVIIITIVEGLKGFGRWRRSCFYRSTTTSALTS